MDTEKASNFINSLVRNLQVLCHSNVDFSEDVEVIGHIYLSVDKSKKFNYIVNEKVCKNDNSSTVFVSNSFHADQQKKKDNDLKNSKNANKLQLEQSNENEIKQQRMLGFHGNRDSQFHHPSPSKRHLSHSENSSGNQKLRRKSSVNQDKRHAESVSTASGMSMKMEPPASSLGDTFSPNKSHQPVFSSPAASPVKGLSSSDPVDVDLTSVKDEPDDENSSLFSQNTAWNQQPDPTYDIPRAGPSDDMFGMYPPVHQLSQQEAQSNLEVLAQMSGQNPSGSGDSPDNQMPLVPSGMDYIITTNDVSSNREGANCPFCGLRLSQKRSLAQHVREKHINIRHKCEYCDASFSRLITKKNHVIRVHTNTLS